MATSEKTCSQILETAPCNEIPITIKDSIEIDNFQLRLDNDTSGIREVVIEIDSTAITKLLDELTTGIANLSPDVRLEIINNVGERVRKLLVDGKLYASSKPLSTSRTSHRIVLVPSGEFVELVGTVLVRARERKNNR